MTEERQMTEERYFTMNEVIARIKRLSELYCDFTVNVSTERYFVLLQWGRA